MPEILEIMANNYTINPLPPYLYLMEISMTVFTGENEDNQIRDKIIDSFNRLVDKTFRIFEDL